MAKAKTEKAITPRSMGLPRFSAATAPSVMPQTSEISSAVPPRRKVAGRRSRKICSDGRPEWIE